MNNIVILLLIILIIILALLILKRNVVASLIFGGGTRVSRAAESKHIIIDALNLTHWLKSSLWHDDTSIQFCDIIRAIDETAPILCKKFTGQVMYVTKDRESVFNDLQIRAIYQNAARRNKVYVIVAERYIDPPAGTKPSLAHSARGRDDFLMSLLAWELRSAVLTKDRLKDFNEFRSKIPPFHTLEFIWWKDQPNKNYINPNSPAYSKIIKPITFDFEKYI
jgi:hypothetical protein